MRTGDELVYSKVFYVCRVWDKYNYYKKPLKVYVQLEIHKGKRTDWETLKVMETHEVSFSGDILTLNGSYGLGRGWVYGGQIEDILMKTINENKIEQGNKEAIIELVRLWKEYHSNDLKAGTKRQEEKVKEYFKKGLLKEYDYDKVCELLKQDGLYEDNRYKYGHGWLTKPVSEEELNYIINFMESNFKVIKEREDLPVKI